MNYFESGTTHRLNLQALNPTAYSWKYRFDIILEGQVVDSIEREIDTGVTKLLSTDITMPEVSEPTELTFEVHAYEISASPAYDLGIVASTSVIVQELPSGGAYNAEAYFDDVRLANYEFEAGSAHKITVKFTNPFDAPLEFYLAGRLGSMDLFNQMGFFTVAAGQTVTKEANFLVGETLGLVGPVPISVHCTTSGVPGEDFETGSVEIIESSAVQDGTIEVVPVQTSVGQGRPLEFDVKITNSTSKRWTYNYTVSLADASGAGITGVTSSVGVAPYSSVTQRHRVSVLYNTMLYPPVGTAYFKAKFMGTWRNLGTINITSAGEPGVTASLSSYKWTDMTYYMFQATIKNTASVQKTYDVYAYIFDGSEFQTMNVLGTITLGAGQSGSVENSLMPYYVGTFDVKVKIVTYEPDSWVVSELKTFAAGKVTISE